MSNQVQLRRGTTSEHSTFTGALAEITVDTTTKRLVLHDGTTAGGIPLATYADVTSGSLDSGAVKAIIDSDYINSIDTPSLDTGVLAGNYLVLGMSNGTGVSVNLSALVTGGITALDSSQILNLIDADYINSNVIYDSSNTLGLINSTVDSTFVNSLVNILDSADVALIAQANDTRFDSAGVIGLVTDTVDSAFVNNLVTIPDAGTDSATVVSIINTTVDSTFVNGLVNILDSADVALIAQANDTRFDSADIQAIIDSDFGTRTTDDLSEGSNKLYYNSTRVDSDIYAFINDSNSAQFSEISVNGTYTFFASEGVLVDSSEIAINTGNVYSPSGLEYLITLYDSSTGSFQVSKILALYDGNTSVNFTQYGDVYIGNGELATFDVRDGLENVVLYATRKTPNNIRIKVKKTII